MHVRTSDRRFQIPSDPDKEVDLEIEEEAVGTPHSAERCLANKFDLRETIYRSFISSTPICNTVLYHHCNYCLILIAFVFKGFFLLGDKW